MKISNVKHCRITEFLCSEAMSVDLHTENNQCETDFLEWLQWVSNIRRTEFQNLNDSRPVLQLSLPNLLKPCIKPRMKM